MTNSAAPLTIRLLGVPEVEVHGQPFLLKNQKARALLFYLAVAGQAHSRSHLATLFWSEFTADNARRSLRAPLCHLRGALQDASLNGIITDEGDLLRLHLAENACD